MVVLSKETVSRDGICYHLQLTFTESRLLCKLIKTRSRISVCLHVYMCCLLRTHQFYEHYNKNNLTNTDARSLLFETVKVSTIISTGTCICSTLTTAKQILPERKPSFASQGITTMSFTSLILLCAVGLSLTTATCWNNSASLHIEQLNPSIATCECNYNYFTAEKQITLYTRTRLIYFRQL